MEGGPSHIVVPHVMDTLGWRRRAVVCRVSIFVKPVIVILCAAQVSNVGIEPSMHRVVWYFQWPLPTTCDEYDGDAPFNFSGKIVNSRGSQLMHGGACALVMWTGSRPVRNERLVGLQHLFLCFGACVCVHIYVHVCVFVLCVCVLCRHPVRCFLEWIRCV